MSRKISGMACIPRMNGMRSIVDFGEELRSKSLFGLGLVNPRFTIARRMEEPMSENATRASDASTSDLNPSWISR